MVVRVHHPVYLCKCVYVTACQGCVGTAVHMPLSLSFSDYRTLHLPEHLIFTIMIQAGPKVLSHSMVSMETDLFIVISFGGRHNVWWQHCTPTERGQSPSRPTVVGEVQGSTG